MLVLAACSAGSSTPPPPPPGYAFPALSGRVVDAAQLLPRDVVKRLTAKSADLDRRWGHQLVVVTVRDLSGHKIEDYGLALGNYWGIGRKGVDDGVLFLVAPRERQVRIEVGLGLEQALTNDEASQILQEQVLPAFRRGDMVGGIETGVDDIIHEISVPVGPRITT